MLTTSTTMASTYGAAAGPYGSETASPSSNASFRSQSKLREILRDQSRREEQQHQQHYVPTSSFNASTPDDGSSSSPTSPPHAVGAKAERPRRPSLVSSVSAAVLGTEGGRTRRETLVSSSKTSSQLDAAAMASHTTLPTSHGALHSASALQRQRSLRRTQDREADTAAPDGVPSRVVRSHSTATNLSGGIDLKVVILGSQGVGKTSLVHRYTSGQFSASAVPSTIGASFLTKKLIVDGVKVRLQLWDTAGQERFRSMAPMYYRGANAAVIVYDITNPHTFEDVKTWIDELRQNVQSDLVIHIVGSKVDLAAYARKVYLDDAQRAVVQWTQANDAQPVASRTQLAPSTSFFGNRKGLSTSPSLFARAAPITTSPPSSPVGVTSSGGSRIPGLGSLAALGSKGTREVERQDGEGDQVSNPSTASSSATKQASSQDWDFIEVSEVSAKDNEGIEDVFVGIATRLVERKEELEARALAKKRQERESIFLGDEAAPAGYPVRTGEQAAASWCCST